MAVKTGSTNNLSIVTYTDVVPKPNGATKLAACT